MSLATPKQISLGRVYSADKIALVTDHFALSWQGFEQKMAIWASSYGNDEIQGYDEFGRKTSSVTSAAWQLGYTVAGEYFVNYGFSFSFLHSELESYSSNAILGNGHLRYSLTDEFSLGVKVNHLGFGEAYDRREIVMPMAIQVGTHYAHEVLNDLTLNCFVDYLYRNDEGSIYPVAIELEYSGILAFRMGWGIQRKNALATAGVSVHLDWLHVSYGFEGHKYLGGTHLVELTFDMP